MTTPNNDSCRDCTQRGSCEDYQQGRISACSDQFTPAPVAKEPAQLPSCINLRELVKGFLNRKGFDGLFNTDVPCGCKVDDLNQCDGDMSDCRPGYLVDCGANDECGCDGQGTAHWHIEAARPNTPAPAPAPTKRCLNCGTEDCAYVGRSKSLGIACAEWTPEQPAPAPAPVRPNWANGCGYDAPAPAPKVEDAPTQREPAGFVNGQAMAWEDVWDECIRLGMNTDNSQPDGKYDVLAFIRTLAQRAGEMDKKYHELIFAVGNCYSGESRHETALRYIREAEKGSTTSECNSNAVTTRADTRPNRGGEG